MGSRKGHFCGVRARKLVRPAASTCRVTGTFSVSSFYFYFHTRLRVLDGFFSFSIYTWFFLGFEKNIVRKKIVL